MKTTLKELEKLKEKIEEKVELRDETFNERTEKWQDSEKGEFYNDKTAELQYVLDSVEDAISNMEDYLA